MIRRLLIGVALALLVLLPVGASAQPKPPAPPRQAQTQMGQPRQDRRGRVGVLSASSLPRRSAVPMRSPSRRVAAAMSGRGGMIRATACAPICASRQRWRRRGSRASSRWRADPK